MRHNIKAGIEYFYAGDLGLKLYLDPENGSVTF